MGRRTKDLDGTVAGTELSPTVKSAQRILDIIEFFSNSRGPATLSEMSAVLRIPKSSCLGLLNTLEKNGFIYMINSQLGYYPTRRWLDLSETIAANDPILIRIKPVLEELRDRTGETVILGQPLGVRIMYLEVVASRQTVRYTAQVGQFKPLHGTSSGKAFLGSLNNRDRREFISRLDLKPLTTRTITDPAVLDLDIATGSARGWHVAVGENEPDVTSVATSLKLADQTYIVVVAAPTHRLEGKLEQIGRLLQQTATQSL